MGRQLERQNVPYESGNTEILNDIDAVVTNVESVLAEEPTGAPENQVDSTDIAMDFKMSRAIVKARQGWEEYQYGRLSSSMRFNWVPRHEVRVQMARAKIFNRGHFL